MSGLLIAAAVLARAPEEGQYRLVVEANKRPERSVRDVEKIEVKVL